MSSLVTVCPQDLSETEITHVVPFTIEDAIESPPLTPPTPEALHLNQQLPRAFTPLNCVTNGVVSPTWPETRLQPIQNMSADAKKLLQIYDDIHCLSINPNLHNN